MASDDVVLVKDPSDKMRKKYARFPAIERVRKIMDEMDQEAWQLVCFEGHNTVACALHDAGGGGMPLQYIAQTLMTMVCTTVAQENRIDREKMIKNYIEMLQAVPMTPDPLTDGGVGDVVH